MKSWKMNHWLNMGLFKSETDMYQKSWNKV